jgi:hypothetical protein
MTATLPESILIQVNYFAEGNFWIVSADKYDRDDNPNDPEQFDDATDHREYAQAIADAENKAQWIIATRQAKRATILINGNEHSCLVLDGPDPRD